MSSVEPEMREHLVRPRSKVFSIGGDIYDSSGEDAKRLPLPFLPPTNKVFDMFFFWELYDYLAKRTLRQDVPLVAVRNMSCKLMITFDEPDPQDVNFFGSISKKFCSWKDVRRALLREGHPTLRLTTIERIFMTLDDDRSCRLAQVWFWFILLVTVANLVRMVKPHYVQGICDMADLGDCTNSFQVMCLVVFSVDYLVRLACAPFVRLELLSPQLEYFNLDDFGRRPFTRKSRVMEFVKKSDNLVDLVAIMPYWLNILVGQFLPSSSFLRIIRLARLFRIAKSARYLDMLQVLAMTLWKSTSMVAILFVLIQLVALIAGCLLQEFEENDGEMAFDSVLSAWYWIFCRLIAMKDTPYHKGKVTTDGGIAILAITLTLKGVLWIVPIARIKQIFESEYSAVVKGSNLEKKVVSDLLGQFNDSDKDHLVSAAHGSTNARMEVVLEAGRVQANVPLPIHHTEIKDIPEFVVEASSEQLANVSAKVSMRWEPDQSMTDHDEALPFGKLALSVVSVDPPAPIKEVNWEVPCDFFRPERKTMSWTASSHAMCKFAISWMGRYVEDKQAKKKEADDDEHETLAYGEFQAKVLYLLNQQSITLQRQRKKLEKQRKHLEGLDANTGSA